MKDRSVVLYRIALAGLLVGFFAVPAYAGFEWTPPPAAPAIAATPEGGPLVPAAPAAAVESMELIPVSQAPVAVDAVISDVAPKPLIERESGALPVTPAETLETPAASGPFAEALGFGSDIPLALALGQIVPAEFAYSFASNVNPGVKISWNGGKPWNEVLNEALEPLNLRAEIIGTAVIVRNATPSFEMPAVVESQQNTMIPRPPVYTAQPLVTATPASNDTSTTPAQRGEGTSDNYPRRSPQRKNFMDSIFTPDKDKGNTAPPPPQTQEEGVLIENEVSPATQAASVAPAAPAAVTPIPASDAPVLLRAQKISYADDRMEDTSPVMADRPMAQSASVGSNSPDVLDPLAVRFWQADSNRNLRDVLEEWSTAASVEMIWDSGYEYKLPASFSLHGTFPDAVTKVFSLYGKVEPRPQGKLHPNLPKGPSVLLVENYP